MKTFDISKAKTPQRKAFNELHKALTASFFCRGPYETKNGWPYYLIDTATQTLSVRSTKSAGKRIFVVYEKFGDLSDNPPSHQVDKGEVVSKIDELINKDIDNWALRDLI